jgi:hypothetical protein
MAAGLNLCSAYSLMTVIGELYIPKFGIGTDNKRI